MAFFADGLAGADEGYEAILSWALAGDWSRHHLLLGSTNDIFVSRIMRSTAVQRGWYACVLGLLSSSHNSIILGFPSCYNSRRTRQENEQIFGQCDRPLGHNIRYYSGRTESEVGARKFGSEVSGCRLFSLSCLFILLYRELATAKAGQARDFSLGIPECGTGVLNAF